MTSAGNTGGTNSPKPIGFNPAASSADNSQDSHAASNAAPRKASNGPVPKTDRNTPITSQAAARAAEALTAAQISSGQKVAKLDMKAVMSDQSQVARLTEGMKAFSNLMPDPSKDISEAESNSLLDGLDDAALFAFFEQDFGEEKSGEQRIMGALSYV